MCMLFDSGIQFLGICPKVIKIHIKFLYKDTHPSVLYDKEKIGNNLSVQQ